MELQGGAAEHYLTSKALMQNCESLYFFVLQFNGAPCVLAYRNVCCITFYMFIPHSLHGQILYY